MSPDDEDERRLLRVDLHVRGDSGRIAVPIDFEVEYSVEGVHRYILKLAGQPEHEATMHAQLGTDGG